MFWHVGCNKQKKGTCILVTCFILSAISPALLFLLLLLILDLWRFNVNFDLLGRYAGRGMAVQTLAADGFFWKKGRPWLICTRSSVVTTQTTKQQLLCFGLVFFDKEMQKRPRSLRRTLIWDENSFLDELLPRLSGGDFPLEHWKSNGQQQSGMTAAVAHTQTSHTHDTTVAALFLLLRKP